MQLLNLWKRETNIYFHLHDVDNIWENETLMCDKTLLANQVMKGTLFAVKDYLKKLQQLF